MTLAAGGAVALGAAPLGAIFEEWRWVWYAWAAVAAVAGAHLLARSARLPAVLVPAAGALGLLVYLTAVFAADGALLGLLPTPDSMALLRDGLDSGFANVNELAAPVPATPGLILLTSAALGVVAIAVDIVAVSLRRPAASGLALLALYAVPTAVARDGVPWILFAIGATGYLMLLMVEGRDRLLHWGRPIGGSGEPGESDAPLPLTGQRIGAAAIALAVVVPLFVPGLTGNALSRLGRTGSGESGTGSGTGPLNEFASLRGELRRGTPQQLMQVRTDLEQPLYLRTKVLDNYQLSGFRASGRNLESGLGDDLALPTGQTDNGGRSYRTTIRLTDNYRDDHLPIYYVPRRVRDAGDGWSYDQGKAVVFGPERDGGFEYTVEGVAPNPSAAELGEVDTLSGDARRQLEPRLSSVPNSLPQTVRDTVRRITGNQPSPYGKAKALNDFFTDGTFKYDLTTVAGNSGSALVDFLKNKQGYCEQYAAAMAIMLRVAEVPSRVVLGYTAGTRGEDGSYSVTTSDAHAWVEAYFQNVGWVYFDPTPLSGQRTIAPPYAPRPEATPTATATGSAGVTGSAGPTANQLPAEDLNPGTAAGDSQGTSLLTPRRALVAGVVLVVLVLLVAPAVLRLTTRRRRLRAAAGTDAEAAARAAWDEVLGTAADYGLPVPRTETPRALARRLGREMTLDTEAATGLRLVALAEERARYAARAGVDGDLPAAVRAVRRGLRADAGRRQRWRATLLPPSTVRAARSSSAVRAASATSAMTRLGDAVRRPVTPRRR